MNKTRRTGIRLLGFLLPLALGALPPPAAAGPECPDPRSSTAAPCPSLPDSYAPPAFRMSARSEFLDGALYDDKGQLLCVLGGNPGAFVYTGTRPAGPVTATFCAQVGQEIASGSPGDIQSLQLSNNDLLRRLLWLYGEGGCNPVDAACAPTARDCGPAPAGQWGSIYYAYVIKNLRKSYRTDDGMLRSACRDATRSFYEPYFVTGNSNTRPMLAAAKEPSRWSPNPPSPDAAPCGGDEVCWARARVSRCLQDLIHAQRDTADADSPLAGAPNAWLGEVGPRSVDRGHVCPKTMPRILVHSWANLPMLECFHKF